VHFFHTPCMHIAPTSAAQRVVNEQTGKCASSSDKIFKHKSSYSGSIIHNMETNESLRRDPENIGTHFWIFSENWFQYFRIVPPTLKWRL
jgi:hypothetical protein